MARVLHVDSLGKSEVFRRGGGCAQATVTFAGIRERLKYSSIPEGLQSTGIASIIMGLMAIGFMGFSGLRLESGG